mgnify:CR=1 FL=1
MRKIITAYAEKEIDIKGSLPVFQGNQTSRIDYIGKS